MSNEFAFYSQVSAWHEFALKLAAAQPMNEQRLFFLSLLNVYTSLRVRVKSVQDVSVFALLSVKASYWNFHKR